MKFQNRQLAIENVNGGSAENQLTESACQDLLNATGALVNHKFVGNLANAKTVEK